MLHIGDKVTVRGVGNRVYTIVHISDNGGTVRYRGFDWEYMVPSDLLKESEMTVVERTTEPNTITVGDDVLVSKYSDTQVIHESSGIHRAREVEVIPETPVHGIVFAVNGMNYQHYRVLLDGSNVKVEHQDITRAEDYTLF